MVSLIVNNKTLDLGMDAEVPINFRSTEVGAVDEILLSYTNTFEIPDTDTNRAILENAQQINYNSAVPYKILSSQLLFHGRDLFGESRLILTEYNSQKGWSANFIAGQPTNVFGSSIRDLELSDYDFILNTANAVALRNTTAGVLYSPMDFGNNVLRGFTYPQFDINKSYFSFYAITLLERIFLPLNIPLLFPNNNGLIQRLVLACPEPKKTDAEVSGASFVNARNQVQTFTTGVSFVILYNQPISGTSSINPTTGVVTLNKSGTIKIRATVENVNIQSELSTPRYLFIDLTVPDVPVYTAASAELVPNTAGVHSLTVEFVFSVYLVAPDVATFRVRWQKETPGTLTIGDVFPAANSGSLTVEYTDDVVYGSTISVAKSLPEISKTDFVSAITAMATSIVTVGRNGLSIMQFDKLPFNPAVDWSEKLNVAKEYTINPNTDSFARSNKFLYDNDDETPGEDYAGARVTFDSEIFQAETDIIKLPFSGSVDSFFQETWLSMFVPQWNWELEQQPNDCARDGNTKNVVVSGGAAVGHRLSVGDMVYVVGIGYPTPVTAIIDAVRFTIETQTGAIPPNFTFSVWYRYIWTTNRLNPRIGYVIDSEDYGDWQYRGANQATLAAHPYKRIQFSYTDGAGKNYSLGWPTLLKNFSRTFLGSMERYKMVRAFMNLNDDDVGNVNNLNPVYIQKFGTYFYLQAINKYIGTVESSECEFIAIGNQIDESKITDL